MYEENCVRVIVKLKVDKENIKYNHRKNLKKIIREKIEEKDVKRVEKSKETIIETISRNEKDGKINQECISTVTLVTLIIQKKKREKKIQEHKRLRIQEKFNKSENTKIKKNKEVNKKKKKWRH